MVGLSVGSLERFRADRSIRIARQKHKGIRVLSSQDTRKKETEKSFFVWLCTENFWREKLTKTNLLTLLLTNGNNYDLLLLRRRRLDVDGCNFHCVV